MAAGMWPPAGALPAAGSGALIGVGVLVFTYLANAWIQPHGMREQDGNR
jgi:hypothetical protein